MLPFACPILAFLAVPLGVSSRKGGKSSAFVMSVVSIPLLLDRDVGLLVAIETSFKAVQTNPGPMILWAAIIAGALVLGSLPLLVGLIVVVPLLSHASWKLYRKVVA